jgi:cAMP phosphodiesterase
MIVYKHILAMNSFQHVGLDYIHGRQYIYGEPTQIDVLQTSDFNRNWPEFSDVKSQTAHIKSHPQESRESQISHTNLSPSTSNRIQPSLKPY